MMSEAGEMQAKAHQVLRAAIVEARGKPRVYVYGDRVMRQTNILDPKEEFLDNGASGKAWIHRRRGRRLRIFRPHDRGHRRGRPRHRSMRRTGVRVSPVVCVRGPGTLCPSATGGAGFVRLETRRRGGSLSGPPGRINADSITGERDKLWT